MPATHTPVDSREANLHMAVWLADRRRVNDLLEARADINGLDAHGASPLMLATDLLPRAREYEHMARHLLERRADPRQRSANGWSPLDVAVSRGDERFVRMLFERSQQNLQQRWQARLGPLMQTLQALPDFECRIRWEFESPVVPLLNKIAPSDIVMIRKRGASLRLDSTLASWKRFRFSKRRDLTTLFQARNDVDFPSSKSGPGSMICMLNHAKQVAVDVTAQLDQDEASAVVEDLVAADAMQWDMHMDNLEVMESTSWLGQALGPCDVNGWKTTRFDVRGSLGVVVQTKGCRNNCATFEDYFGLPLPPDACLPELQEEFMREATSGVEVSKLSRSEAELGDVAGLIAQQTLEEDLMDIDSMSNESEVLEQWPEPASSAAANMEQCDSRDCEATSTLFTTSGVASSGTTPAAASAQGHRASQVVSGKTSTDCACKKKESGDKLGRSTRTVSASVWLATDFAVPMHDFLPVLEALSSEHEAMHRLRELLASRTMHEAVERARQAAAAPGGGGSGHVFPVKVSVPLNLAVRALAHFELFELRNDGELPASLFEVPEHYRWVPRRDAQKTLNRRRKRMFLAHLAM